MNCTDTVQYASVVGEQVVLVSQISVMSTAWHYG